jgi:hypothetical protein
MRRPARHAIRLIALFAVIASIQFISGARSSSTSPYVSALSDLAVGTAWAAKPAPCADKTCDNSDPSVPICVFQKKVGTNCKIITKFGMTFCQSTAC